MDKNVEEKESIVNDAFQKGVEVIWAKKPQDIQHEGIHLMDPDAEKLLDGLAYAIMLGVRRIVIHSGETWVKSLSKIAKDGKYELIDR